MSINAEPVPAVPPDISKPLSPKEPTPPSPEAPKKGIEVEVYQPDMIHKIAVELGNGSRNLADLHDTDIEDGLIRRTLTNLWCWGAQRGNEYNFQSWFHLSTDVGERPDYGYYGPDRIASLQSMLEGKGYTVKFQQHPVDPTGALNNSLVLTKDGQAYELNLGFGSRQAEEDHIRKEVELDRKRKPNEPGYAEKYDLLKIEKGLVENLIYFEGTPRRLALGAETSTSAVYDKEKEFTGYLETYAKVYQDIINMVYDEAGIEPPKNRTITFRPPVLSQDALTQIASTQTETPIHMVESQVSQEMPSFEDIAGQDTAVAEAKRLVLAINHPEVFEKRGVKRPKGILFYGPPGTGKTLIAKAVAHEANADFLEVSAADIGTKWYGESERLMQRVFDIANEAVAKGRRVVLFFDELDALAPARGEAHEATKKVVATLLQNMDGFRANPNVTIIAASNRPQDIDPALKRPGRIDKLIPVGLPSAEGRSAILKVHMEKAKKTAKAPGELFSAEIDLEQLGQATDGMSGADLANLVNLALENNVMAELEGSPWSPVSTEEMVSTAKRLGLLEEEKGRIGFKIPPQNKGGSPQT